jgi:hypothetical protein
MNGLKIFFENPGEFKHPKERAWTKLVQDGHGKLSCEVVRQREGLGYRPAKIYLHSDVGGAIVSDHDDWDNELNRFLLKYKIRAISNENEAVRYALMLKAFLRRPETRYGDGYFNAVLLEMVEKTFSESEQLKSKLKEIGPGNPNHGRVYQDCVDMIKDAIATCALSLLNDLGYDRPAAENILANAMGFYLDERFSLENKKRLGL